MGVIDDILGKIGLKWDELTGAERETLSTWLEALEKNKLTVEQIRTHITAMRDAVILELTQPDLPKEKDLILKARLRNYTLIEAFLSTPEKAKAALDRAIAGIVSKK